MTNTLLMQETTEQEPTNTEISSDLGMDLLNRVTHTDYLLALRAIPDESVDLVVTDPPYKVISGGRKRNSGQPSGILDANDGKIFRHNDVDMSVCMKELYRVLKQGTHCYVMTNVLNLKDMIVYAEQAGFKLHNILIWKKNNVTPSQYYMKNAEYILFIRKGKAKYINNIGTKTVLEVNNIRNKQHPTEKPIELMRILIENSSNVGDVVLDPFVGAGSTALASIETKRNFIALEIDEEYVAIANKRIADARELASH